MKLNVNILRLSLVKILNLEFGWVFEGEFRSRFWDWNLVGILMLSFYRDFELKSSCLLSFWSWCLVEIWELNLVKILKMNFDQPMEWLKSYFGESTLLFGPLWVWQCFSLIFLFYILWCIAELALVTVPVGVSRAQPLSSIKPRLTHPDTHLCNDSPPKTLSKTKQKIPPEMEKAPPHKLQTLIHCLNCLQSCIYADKYCYMVRALQKYGTKWALGALWSLCRRWDHTP